MLRLSSRGVVDRLEKILDTTSGSEKDRSGEGGPEEASLSWT